MRETHAKQKTEKKQRLFSESTSSFHQWASGYCHVSHTSCACILLMLLFKRCLISLVLFMHMLALSGTMTITCNHQPTLLSYPNITDNSIIYTIGPGVRLSLLQCYLVLLLMHYLSLLYLPPSRTVMTTALRLLVLLNSTKQYLLRLPFLIMCWMDCQLLTKQ